MGYTFDGPNKLIILTTGTTNVSWQDMYSRWVDWVVTSDNIKYPLAFNTVGGDTLPGGVYLGITYFLENGWKVRPQEADHSLTLSGNGYSRDGSSPLVPTVGTYNVVVSMTVSNLLNTVSTGGYSYTVGEIAEGVWANANRNITNDIGNEVWGRDLSPFVAGTAGHWIYKKLLSISKFIGLK